jgi:hypothetical protein
MYLGINRPFSVSRRRQAKMWSAYRRSLSGAASTVLLILLSRSSISALLAKTSPAKGPR